VSTPHQRRGVISYRRAEETKTVCSTLDQFEQWVEAQMAKSDAAKKKAQDATTVFVRRQRGPCSLLDAHAPADMEALEHRQMLDLDTRLAIITGAVIVGMGAAFLIAAETNFFFIAGQWSRHVQDWLAALFQ